jgi:beta-galactosidase/beta-glucuronidase
MTQLIIAFRNFAKAPNKKKSLSRHFYPKENCAERNEDAIDSTHKKKRNKKTEENLENKKERTCQNLSDRKAFWFSKRKGNLAAENTFRKFFMG